MDEQKPAGHPHAELMIEFGSDSLTCAEAWKNWQLKDHGPAWKDCMSPPLWVIDYQYRRKPRTIKIGDCEIQAPERVAPAVGSKYWSPNVTRFYLSETTIWLGKEDNMMSLACGLVHLTPEAAEAHAKALIALTAIK